MVCESLEVIDDMAENYPELHFKRSDHRSPNQVMTVSTLLPAISRYILGMALAYPAIVLQVDNNTFDNNL
jgi:hypothetical protein